MNTKGIITVIVTIAIGVILTTGILVPVIQDVSNSDTQTSVKSISASPLVVWLTTDDGKLFGTGDNESGQQGIDTGGEPVTEFTQRLAGENVKEVVTDGSATWVITTDGKLFGTGYNSTGQQGSGTTDNVTEFTQRLANESVKEVISTSNITWVITNDGKLFGCGTNPSGQQGSGDTTDVTTFTQRLTGENVKEVVTTGSTTWVITDDGKLFGTGFNSYGQQGSGDTTDVTTFTQRLTGENVKEVVTTGSTTWVITTDGKLFGCGRNLNGQQGSGDTTDVTTFTQRLTGENVKEVVASSNTTWAITTDGKLFGCGKNNYGQQGSGTSGSNTNVTTFTQRLTGENVKEVATTNGETVWAITTDGKLFGCGRNNSGQQGSGDTTNVLTFTQRLTGENVKEVVTTGYTTWVITDDGKLFGCGKNGSGQQGSGTTDNVTTFTQRLTGENVKEVAANSDYTTWVITTDGKLFGTGDNYYGQQGIDTGGEPITEFTLHDFSDSESSGNGVSPTILTMLSVIPLIVIVGLIVVTVGYFIRRE